MNHISALTWFRFESNSLGPVEWLGLRWHLLRCRVCAGQLAKRQALSAPTRPNVWALRLAVSLASLVVVAGTSAVFLSVPRQDNDLVPKGDSQFTLVKVQAHAAPFGAECNPGDVLQAEVRSHRSYVVVIGVSPSGAQVLYPVNQPRSAALRDGRLQLPNSWVIDEVPGSERFVAVLSDSALDVEQTAQAVLRGQRIQSADVISRECRKTAKDAGP